MHQVTIAPAGAARHLVTQHPDWPTAHRHLIDYVIGLDFYLQAIQTTPPRTSYELLDLGDIAEEHRCRAQGRQPRIVGHAVIEELARITVEAPYYTAATARHWIDNHHVLWEHGADNDPATRYPLTILAAARAEGHYLYCAGTLLPEAAQLAGVDTIPQPDHSLLETLRDTATGRACTDAAPSPAALAAAVTEHTTPNTPPAHTAALIWWYALITWGATAA